MITLGQLPNGSYKELAVNTDGTLRRTPTKVFAASDAIANLPANATATLVFDLGQDWDQYGWIGITIYPQGSATGPASLSGSDDGTTSQGLLPMSTGAEFYLTSVGANSQTARQARPRGRYLRLSIAGNPSQPLGAASRVYCAAYPH